MTARLNLAGSAAQGLALVLLAVCAAGLLGYVQAGRQFSASAGAAIAGGAEGAAPDAAARASSPLRATAAAPKPVPRWAGGSVPDGTQQTLVWPVWEFKLKEPVPPREPPLTPLNWRLIGAAQSGKVWQVVILRQGRPAPEFFRVGESLPGGYLIEAISDEDVTLVHRRRRMVVAYIGS